MEINGVQDRIMGIINDDDINIRIYIWIYGKSLAKHHTLSYPLVQLLRNYGKPPCLLGKFYGHVQ